ncbi:MAG TPA: ABC transporter substrate-binding protein [Bryobacteraceae bacterium]|jgi:ABC-type nitrate/sulfonate/bicarbonate transport system substrate-binding protein
MKLRIWFSCLLAALFATNAPAQQKITINYPNRSGSNWPLFLAKEGGYYQNHGLDVTLTFGVMPAGIAMLVSGEGQMVNSSLEQLMQAASKDGSMVLVGSSLNRGVFALMAAKNIGSIKELKGKRIAVGQLGDAPYGYLVALLSKAGLSARDVTWIPVGTDVNGRAAALVAGRADATLLTAPAYFKVEEQGFKTLANLADHPEIFASTAYLMKKSVVTADPKLPEKLIEAQAEGIKRFYEDKAFAVQTFLKYDKTAQADEVARVYDLYAKPQAFERVPFVLAPAVKSVLDQQSDPQVAAQMKAYDFHKVIDNSYVERLVKDGFFEKTFGPAIKAEEDRKAKSAFR